MSGKCLYLLIYLSGPIRAIFFFKLRLLLKSEIPFPEASQVFSSGLVEG